MSGPPAGLLVVDKPAGWTSHDVVGRVRRLAGTRKVGHAGTLDPMATGVLVLGLGPGTRLLTSSSSTSYAGKCARAAAAKGMRAEGTSSGVPSASAKAWAMSSPKAPTHVRRSATRCPPVPSRRPRSRASART